MLDFLKIDTRVIKNKVVEIYPKFIARPSEDLMIRGGDFYAIWNDKLGFWSKDENIAITLIDNALASFAYNYQQEHPGEAVRVLYLWDTDTKMIDKWHRYVQVQLRDNYKPLNEKLIFQNDEINKKDYATTCLEYSLSDMQIPAYDRLMNVLYSPEERLKLEWAIGSIVTGYSKKIQKFIVLYGGPGTGKSTILNIIQMLFKNYWTVFEASDLGSNSAFSLETLKTNPLVAIQHDGDLSRIENNTRLNSIVSHETMTINEKFKSPYPIKFISMLFIGTNKPVKITDGKSGLIRRLIDVTPTGKTINRQEYEKLLEDIKYELGGIANRCKEVYLTNQKIFDDYKPKLMMDETNTFYSFVSDNYFDFKRDNGITLSEAWIRYKVYCDDSRLDYRFPKSKFKTELKNYFDSFSDDKKVEGIHYTNYYYDFKTDLFNYEKTNMHEKIIETNKKWIFLNSNESLFDRMYSTVKAQYASSNGIPLKEWDKVNTTLENINTDKLHYVKVPEYHIVIDFDIKDENGNKSLEKNLEAANKFKETYVELSKSGKGIHLHYIYDGDINKLSRVYDDEIEIKVFSGNSSLRRQLTKCNDISISTISSGLPLKGEKTMINWDGVKSEKMLRSMIKKNLNKEYHAATKPSIDYIYKLLEDTYNSGIKYDVSDLRQQIWLFALGSTNQSKYCTNLFKQMKFKSEEQSLNKEDYDNDKIVFYDIEVFPNLFIVNWKYENTPKCNRMINPTPKEIEELVKMKLVGFNNRRYDNHILYARMMGYSIEQLFNKSKQIVRGDSKDCFFGEAYNISYTDVYDFSSKKQSLKKWEIELGLIHKELSLPWDKPVPLDKWEEVAEYCDNDVIATEAVFKHCSQDFLAREILASLSGLTVNHTTRQHTTKIIFGDDKNPQLVYTDLSETFPGYEFKDFKNMYMGEDASFGGYVYAEPGIHTNVALLDIASLHPHSIIAMNVFGEYTTRFKELLDARMAIKHHEYDKVKTLLNGELNHYLNNDEDADKLSYALKIIINSVYGYTSATFDNPFKDPRNKNNIVALRGSLFMMTLKKEVQKRGYTVAHIKTDSIKIPDASQDIIDFCMEFAKKYGYTFEHEATYSKMCLVNDAVYIAKYKDGKKKGKWTATGTQFQIPYVFKTLFSKEPIEFKDLCETKSVTSSLYLDMNENLPDVSHFEKELLHLNKELTNGKMDEETYLERKNILDNEINKGHQYIFIGRVGNFCPIKEGCGGGILLREKDGKYHAVTGSKGFRWLESDLVKTLGKEECINKLYYTSLVDEAVKSISKYGDFEWFVSDDEKKEVVLEYGELPDSFNL